MKELRWMDLPKGCRRTSTSIELPVSGDTSLDETPAKTLRMLAVSEEDFIFSFSTQIVPEGARCGLVVYQDPNDWFWASATRLQDDGVLLTSCTAIHGHTDIIELPVRCEENGKATEPTPAVEDATGISWKLQRTGERLVARYSTDDGGSWRLIRDFSLPSSVGSVSFGLLAGNGREKKITMKFSSIAYRSVKRPDPAASASEEASNASNATTALL